MSCKAIDELCIDSFMRGYILSNISTHLIARRELDESDEIDSEIAYRLETEFKREYGYIPEVLKNECLRLNDISNRKKYNEESDVLYDKILKYVKDEIIYKEAHKAAMDYLNKRNSILDYERLLEELKELSEESDIDSLGVDNYIALIIDYKNVYRNEIPIDYESTTEERINFLKKLDSIECTVLDIQDDNGELAENLYNRQDDIFHYYRYNELILKLKSPDNYVLLKMAQIDFGRPWIFQFDIDGAEEIRYLSIDKYNHVYDYIC